METVIAIITSFFVLFGTQKCEEVKVLDDIYYCTYVYAEQYGIEAELVQSIIFHESTWRADAKNGNCIGLMQINADVHQDRINRIAEEYCWADTDLTNPYFNLQVGCDYLSELFERYEDEHIVLSVYHGERNATTKKTYSSYTKNIISMRDRLVGERDE